MAKRFNELVERMTPERQQRVRDQAQNLRVQLALKEIRKARGFTQKEIARNLGISQAALSKMENQGDMQVSTLRRLLGAMGGTLELGARFDEAGDLVSLEVLDASARVSDAKRVEFERTE